MLKNKKDLENENRLENIKELLNAMKEFDNLENFLEHVALATSIDQEWDGEKVNMMTMHAAKVLSLMQFFYQDGKKVFFLTKIYRGKRTKWIGRRKKTCICGHNKSKKELQFLFQ